MGGCSLSVSGRIGSPRKTTCGSQIRRRNQPYKVADRRTPVDSPALAPGVVAGDASLSRCVRADLPQHSAPSRDPLFGPVPSRSLDQSLRKQRLHRVRTRNLVPAHRTRLYRPGMVAYRFRSSCAAEIPDALASISSLSTLKRVHVSATRSRSPQVGCVRFLYANGVSDGPGRYRPPPCSTTSYVILLM